MLKVKTRVGVSKIAGLGLFADERIAKGTVIWHASPATVTRVTKTEFEVSLTDAEREYVKTYGYLWQGEWVICGDNAKYMNHAPVPNTENGLAPETTVASRDIRVGEELTCDYATFHDAFVPFPKEGAAVEGVLHMGVKLDVKRCEFPNLSIVDRCPDCERKVRSKLYGDRYLSYPEMNKPFEYHMYCSECDKNWPVRLLLTVELEVLR